jgi:hypothetical protein
MFYIHRIQKSSFNKQVLVDGVLVSEDSNQTDINGYLKVGPDGNEYTYEFSERTLFASLSDLYSACTKRIKLNIETLVIEMLPDPDFSSLSKEEGMVEIYDCLNYADKLIKNTTVEYFIVEE